jgi:hypothetical protein
MQAYYTSCSVPNPESSHEQVDDLYHPHLLIGATQYVIAIRSDDELRRSLSHIALSPAAPIEGFIDMR